MSIIKPDRFVGLHAHDGFSTYDGLGLPQEHIDFVLKNGMDAWGLTNHGHMNSFAHAYLHAQKKIKAGINFKLIPGCEMYVHPDLDAWKLDYNIQKAAKAGDKTALAKLRAQREQLVSPLAISHDIDGDIIDIDKEAAGLTIENEDASRKSKFYDPVKRRHHMVVLPKTSIGLQRLFHLVSRGYKDGFYRFPRVDYKMLKEAAEGGHLMITSACLSGNLGYEVFRYFQQIEFEQLHASLLDDESIMKNVQLGVGNAYAHMVDAVGVENAKLELQFNKLPAQHLVNRAILKFANDNGLSDNLIVTCDSHYPSPDQWKEREIYKKLGWLNYEQFNPDEIPKTRDELKCELYPKNAEQVWETYKGTGAEHDFYHDSQICDAINRTYDIAHYEIGDIKPDTTMKLPNYVVPKGTTEDRALLDLCKEGLLKRGLDNRPEYIERIKTELRVIKNKGFSKYFLTMKAIMDIAAEHMLVGPGRGSAAGSLVAYVLYITNVDPIEYGLLFSRFLSEHREGCPDIDSDIGDRDQLVKLLKDKFGDYNVVPITNYLTFKLKSLVKDISRFYGIEYSIVNKAMGPLESDVKKAVYKKGTDKNLFTLKFEDAYKYSKSFREFIEEYPQVAEPIKVLFKQNRAVGKHAGGVIVSENVEQRMPLIMARGEVQTPWVEGMHFKHLEDFGWIKFDLLGLETLRIIERAIELILQNKEGVSKPEFADVRNWFEVHMDPKNIDLNDQHVYENVYHKGQWGGIFQCTARGAQSFFKSGKPRSITELAILTSIYRPGPLDAGVHKIYMEAKKNPATIDYGHPLIKQVLEPTVNCIAGDTLVTTDNGDIRIDKIVSEQLVGLCIPSFNEESGEIEQDEIVAAISNGTKETITLELEGGKSIKLTKDHRVWTRQGWVEAGDLTLNDEILCIE